MNARVAGSWNSRRMGVLAGLVWGHSASAANWSHRRRSVFQTFMIYLSRLIALRAMLVSKRSVGAVE